MGMDINYVKKATGKLTAVTKIDPEEFFKLPKYPGRVDLPVNVMNEEGTVVTTAAVRCKFQCNCIGLRLFMLESLLILIHCYDR